jgi:hypothetical protein
MQHYRFHRAVFAVYAMTCALAVLFLSAGVKAVAGLARFPDHYLFNLIGAVCLCWLVTGPREVVMLRKTFHYTRQKAALAYSYTGRSLGSSVRRAARSLAALFTLPSNHKIQTEP